jgi:hypothetical protein
VNRIERANGRRGHRLGLLEHDLVDRHQRDSGEELACLLEQLEPEC